MHQINNPYSDSKEEFDSEDEAKEFTLMMYITNIAYQSSFYFGISLLVLYLLSFIISISQIRIIDTSILITVIIVQYNTLKYHT
jgi:hypothetical protein